MHINFQNTRFSETDLRANYYIVHINIHRSAGHCATQTDTHTHRTSMENYRNMITSPSHFHGHPSELHLVQDNVGDLFLYEKILQSL